MEAPTIGQLRSGPPTVSLLTAAAAIGIGRTKAYELAKRDEFPVAVRCVGATYRVPVAELLRFLHADETIDRAVSYPRESPYRHRRLRSLRALRELPRPAPAEGKATHSACRRQLRSRAGHRVAKPAPRRGFLTTR
jgi:hypothetical protein